MGISPGISAQSSLMWQRIRCNEVLVVMTHAAAVSIVCAAACRCEESLFVSLQSLDINIDWQNAD